MVLLNIFSNIFSKLLISLVLQAESVFEDISKQFKIMIKFRTFIYKYFPLAQFLLYNILVQKNFIYDIIFKIKYFNLG